jgi:hypothetical protein
VGRSTSELRTVKQKANPVVEYMVQKKIAVNAISEAMEAGKTSKIEARKIVEDSIHLIRKTGPLSEYLYSTTEILKIRFI